MPDAEMPPATCPTCGPTTLVPHPRQAGVLRCVNCREPLTPAHGCQVTRRCPIPDDPCDPGQLCWERADTEAPAAPKAPALDRANFVEFWKVYPRKAGESPIGVPEAPQEMRKLAADIWLLVLGKVLNRATTEGLAVEVLVDLVYAAGRKAERNHLRTWINAQLADIADDPDLTTGEAIWREDGYVQALRDVLAEVDGGTDA